MSNLKDMKLELMKMDASIAVELKSLQSEFQSKAERLQAPLKEKTKEYRELQKQTYGVSDGESLDIETFVDVVRYVMSKQ